MLFPQENWLPTSQTRKTVSLTPEAALYRAYAVWRSMQQVTQETFQIFSARICVKTQKLWSRKGARLVVSRSWKWNLRWRPCWRSSKTYWPLVIDFQESSKRDRQPPSATEESSRSIVSRSAGQGEATIHHRVRRFLHRFLAFLQDLVGLAGLDASLVLPWWRRLVMVGVHYRVW